MDKSPGDSLLFKQSALRGVSYALTKKPVSIEVVQEGDERFLVKTYANGETVRESIVKEPRTKRYPCYRHWTFD